MTTNFSSSINIYNFLHGVDLIILGLVILSFCFFAFYKKKNSKIFSNKEYLLMGGGLSLPLFVATLTASWYGGIFGVTQIAFEHGIYSLFTQGLFWYFSYFIFAFFLVKKIKKSKALSLPELIGRRYGSKARSLSSIILFFHALPITYGISIGVFFQVIFGFDFFISMLFGVFFVATYSAFGGFKGVVFTDVFQFFLMFFSVLVLALFSYFRFGGIAFLQAQLDPSFFSPTAEHSLSHTLIWLFVACSSTLIHPIFYQRCLAAKDHKVAFKGILVAMGLWLIFDLCTTFGGMYARALIPKALSEQAFIIYGIQLLPSGIRGLFLAGILSTILSTLDSFLFVSGTSLSYDLCTKSKISWLKNHHLSIYSSAAVVCIFGFAFKADYEEIWLLMEGMFSVAMATPIIFGLLVKRSFTPINFLLPTTFAIIIYFGAYILERFVPLAISPFYLGHITNFFCFALLLKVRAHGKTEAALTANL